MQVHFDAILNRFDQLEAQYESLKTSHPRAGGPDR